MGRWVGGASAFVVIAIVGVVVLTTTSGKAPAGAFNGAAVPAGTSSATPTATPSAEPADATLATPSGGFGDTTTNPDSSFICAAKAPVSGSVIAYMTVAGSDVTSGDALCSDLEQEGPWIGLQSIAAGSYDVVAECFLTSADGAVTARVYAAKPGADDVTMTRTLCSRLFNQADIRP